MARTDDRLAQAAGAGSEEPAPAVAPEPSGPTLLEARGLTKVYPGVVALDGVDLVVRPGELHALLGENGAGKSTLIKIISGAISPDGGALNWEGEPLTLDRPAEAIDRGISVMHQHLALLRRKSVVDNLLLGLGYPHRLGRIRRGEAVAKAREALAILEIDVDPEARMDELPLHKQRMVAVALAVARDARLVVMDEPTASLNANEIDQIRDIVSRLQARGVAVLYVTHRLSEVARGVDWVTVLRNGRVVMSRPGAGVGEHELVTAIAGKALSTWTRTHREGGDALLETSGLTGGAVRALDLRVRRGRILGITGAEGSGLRDVGLLLSGRRPAAAGSMTLLGDRYAPRGPRQALAQGLVYIAQDRAATGMFLRKSLRYNATTAPLAIGRFRKPMLRIDRRAEDAEVDRVSAQLRIAAANREVPVSTLSGGNQQKVLLARALMCQPRVLVLDEPTEGVDVGARREFFDTVDALVDEGTGVVIITSDWEELLRVCDDVVVLREGMRVEEAPASSLTPTDLTRLALGAREEQAA